MCCVQGLLGAVAGALCVSGLAGGWCKRGSVRAPAWLLPPAREPARFGNLAAGLGQQEKSLPVLSVSRLLHSELVFVSG